MTRRYGIGIAAVSLTLAASAALALPAFAQVGVNVDADVGVHAGGVQAGGGATANAHTDWQGGGNGQWRGQGKPGMRVGQMGPGIMGTVTAVNGTTITVAGHSFVAPAAGQKPAMTATTTYTVDASGATIFKGNATSSISSVAANDRIFAEGTVSGTNVTATIIRDGIPGMMMGRRPSGAEGGPGGMTPPVKGNGQPVVAGTVSAVNGSSLTITTSSDTSYTIDASHAVVSKGGATSTPSAITTGEYVVVQGAVNGSSVSADSVIVGSASMQPGNNGNGPKPAGGIMGAIASFFKKIFGF